jgi:hypothetical protein
MNEIQKNITDFISSINSQSNIDFSFNLWDNLIAIISTIINIIVSLWLVKVGYKLSSQISSAEKYKKEKEITEIWNSLPWFKSIVLVDVEKIGKEKKDNYSRQIAETYCVISGVGLEVILYPADEKIPVALIPFEWIEYIRPNGDSMDGKPVIICKFKGIKYYKNFKSPFKKITYYYENKKYKEDVDPEFLRYTPFKQT